MSAKGFTLSEFLVAAVITVIAVGVAMGAVVAGLGIFARTTVAAGLGSDARSAVRRLSDDLREASLASVSITEDFPAAGMDQVTYRLYRTDESDYDGDGDYGEPVIVDSGGDGDSYLDSTTWGPLVTVAVDQTTGELQRSESGETVTLAGDVAQANFTDRTIDPALSFDEIRIYLELQRVSFGSRTENVAETATVNVRN